MVISPPAISSAGARSPLLYSMGPFAALLLAFCFFAPTSFAAKLPSGYEITPVSGSRSLGAFGASFCPGCGPNGEDTDFSNSDSDSTLSVGVWDEGVQSLGSSASQNTSIASDEFGGLLQIRLGGSGMNDANARFKGVFSVASTNTYAIEGIADGFVDQLDISLVSDLGTIFDLALGQGAFREVFVAEPGRTYEVMATLVGFDYSGSNDGGSISFQLVPEPTTGLLVGFGIMVLAVGRRRRT